MANTFVNPLPKIDVHTIIAFDFPTLPGPLGKNKYEAKSYLGNLKTDAPAIQDLYGKLGYPKMDQGHPLIREHADAPQKAYEGGDPDGSAAVNYNYHDQTVDIDRAIRINHTGRLSGSFARYIACPDNYSKVKVMATDLTENGNTLTLDTQIVDLTPVQPQDVNKWYWQDPAARNELIFTLDTIIDDPKKAGLKAEHLYKLLVKWEFWTKNPQERMPMSGFNDEITFEVISKTVDLP